MNAERTSMWKYRRTRWSGMIRERVGHVRQSTFRARSEFRAGVSGASSIMRAIGRPPSEQDVPLNVVNATRTSAAILLRASVNAAVFVVVGVVGNRLTALVSETQSMLRSYPNRYFGPKVASAPVGARRIAMLTISQIDIDPRINKVAASLADNGYTVEVLCFAYNFPNTGDNQIIEVYPGVTYIKTPVRSAFHTYFQSDLLRLGRERSYDYIHVNDLTTGLVGWLLSRERRVPLIYDAHEMWTENVENKGGQFVGMSRRTRYFSTLLERMVVRNASIFITVGRSIQREYLHRYSDILKEAPLLLPNYPSLEMAKPAFDSYQSRLGLEDDAFVVLYLGGVNELRNISSVIQALRDLPSRYHFVVEGPGANIFGDNFMNEADGYGVADRLHILPGVERDEVVASAAGADCGIVMLENICLNFYWFFPNKIFEYAMAGIPVAVSNFPDVSEFVHSERCGVTFDPSNPVDIAKSLRILGDDPDEAVAMGKRGKSTIMNERNWEQAVSGLIGAYRRLEADAEA